MSLEVGAVYRYGRPYSPDPAVKDGLPNFFHATRGEGLPNLLLEAGINTPVRVDRAGIDRLPVVLIRSSPDKARDDAIPWHDHFDLDLGRIDYYGDNRPGGRPAELAPGNEALLAETRLHLSPAGDDRRRAAPVLVFRSVRRDGRVKGQVRFEGLAVIEQCEKIVQVDRTGARYDNFRFRFGLLDLADDGHRIEQAWLADRRNDRLDAIESNRHAPTTWHAWIDGSDAEDIRAVAGPDQPSSMEAAAFGHDHFSVLDVLEERYGSDAEAFTRLAAAIVEFLFRSAGLQYSTRRLHGEDGRFSGRIRLGVSPLGSASDVVGVVDLHHRSTRLSPRTVTGLVESLVPGVLSVVVTRQVIPVRDHSEFTHVVVDGRRIAQTVLQLAHRDRLDVPGVLDRLETRPDSIIGPAVAGHARIAPGTDGES